MLDTLFSLYTLNDLLIATAFLAGGVALGWLFDRIILGRLRKLAARSAWEGDDIIIHAVHGVAIFWFTVGGLYFALVSLRPPQTVLDPAQKIVLFLLLFSATVVAARVGAGLAGLYSRRAVGADRSISIFTYFAKLIIYIVGFLVILQSFGVSITPILTALGVGGLAVALALQDTLGNLFAGLGIIAVRKVRVGEFVRLDSGQDGYVSDISWRYTEIRALSNNTILIPNSKLAGAIVTNFHRPEKEISVTLELGVAYDSDLDKVEAVTIDVAKQVMQEVEGGIPEFQPSISYIAFGESSIRFNAVMRGREYTDQFRLRHEFIKRIKRRYEQEGIVIPLPVRTLLFANGKGDADGSAGRDIVGQISPSRQKP